MFSVLGMSSFLSGADWINDVGLPCAIFYGNLPCFQEIFLSSIFLSSVCGLWWTDNSTDGCFTFNASVMNSAYYSQFGRFSVGWKCLVCCVLLFIFITSNRKKPTSQSITPYTANAKIPCHPRNILASIGLYSKFAMAAGRTKREKCLHKMTIPINVILCMNALCAWAHTHTHGPSHEH